jgi:extradiol dioxygenase family protein
MNNIPPPLPEVSASETIKTTGILHFTIGVRDHIAAAKFYSEVLGCKHMRSSERYSFIQCGNKLFCARQDTSPRQSEPTR